MKKEAMKFTDKAVELFKDVYDISGGSVVVTELPEVGEEHVVYELQEKKVIQSLVPMFNQQMADDGVLGDIDFCFVFNTTEEMTNTFNSIVPTEESGDIYLNYITEEDKLIGAVYTHDEWRFTEARKVSDCKFSVGAIFELEDDAYEVILKEYLGEVQGTIGYRAVLFNDEPYLFEQKTTGILLGTPTIGDMTQFECNEELSEIPPQFPTEYIFETIPYEEIINHQLFDGSDWIFTPKSGEVTEISYWIYSNDTWTNTEDIGKPVEQEVIYGELLKSETFDTDGKFISPYTNEQICNYVSQGKPVILRYHDNAYMSENQFMYVYIYDFQDTEMDVEYVNQNLDYQNFTCRHFSTTDRIRYNREYDYFYYEQGE